MYLSKNACNGYIYGEPSKGLFGIPQAAEDSDISHIDGTFKLLTSRDFLIRDLAWEDLEDTVQDRINDRVTVEYVSDFLSGESFKGSNRISNTWTRSRAASTRLGVTWRFNDDYLPE